MKNNLLVPKEELGNFMRNGAMNNQYGIEVFCEADPERAQALLPPPLKIADFAADMGAIVYIYAVNIREPSFSPWYMEGGIGIMAQYKDIVGVHFLGLQLSGPGALMGMCSGREGSGLPKKICGRIHVERLGNSGQCCIERGGKRILDVKLDIGAYNDPKMKLLTGAYEGCSREKPIDTEGGCLLFRYKLGSGAFTDMEIMHYESPTRFYSWEPASAQVRLDSTPDDPWGEIPISRVLGAGWMVSDNWVRGINTVHTYPDSEALDVMQYLFSGRYDKCTLHKEHQTYE